MTIENRVPRPRKFENSVIAALETCADRRARGTAYETRDYMRKKDNIDRTVAVVEASAARIEAGDFASVEAVFTSHALALDVIFDLFARESADGQLLFHCPMRIALRAQSQCRASLKSLTALKSPRGPRGAPRELSDFSTNGLLKARIPPHEQSLGERAGRPPIVRVGFTGPKTGRRSAVPAKPSPSRAGSPSRRSTGPGPGGQGPLPD